MTRGEVIERLEMLLARVRMRGGAERADRPERNGDSASAAAPVEIDTGGLRHEIAPAEKTEQSLVTDDHDSRERLVVAGIVPREPAPLMQQSAPPLEMGDIEVEVAGEREAEDARDTEDREDEQPPASSRRTVTVQPEERLAEMAFGAEEPRPPLHTPPPESGRLPAAPAADFDTDFKGARDATPMIPRRASETFPRELSPQATRPQRIPSEAVGDVIAEAQRFVPTTFVALLDASLSL